MFQSAHRFIIVEVWFVRLSKRGVQPAEPIEGALIPMIWRGGPWSGNEIMLHVQEGQHVVGQNPSYFVLFFTVQILL